MSLALIQGYSSADDDDGQEGTPSGNYNPNFSDDDSDSDHHPPHLNPSSAVASYKSVFDHSDAAAASSSSSSGLPSAFAAFSEVSRPPQFLNNCVEENVSAREIDGGKPGSGRWKNRKEKKQLPPGAVLESKPLLVGIHERVRSDIEANPPPTSSVPSKTEEGGKRVSTATNPNPEDAAELLRMCLQCGIPKTYSSARGMVCPVCGDRPPTEASNEPKKKGSTIKDKEKSKRMKGQSSHASWKSETEMQLRQQYD